MESTTLHSEPVAFAKKALQGDMKLEVVVIPVSDVDRAKQFYGALGWRLDLDFAKDDQFRVIQFTPHGSQCSIIFGKGITSGRPGSIRGLYLIVSDIVATRTALIERDFEVSEIFHDAGGVFLHEGGKDRVTGLAPSRRSYGSYAAFSDPDGNVWTFQEVTSRLSGHVDVGDTTFTSSTELTGALRRADAAFEQYGKQNSEPDIDWASWYAEYIVRERSGKTFPS